MPAEKFADSFQSKLLLFICGITTVLPWNFFMSAYDYYIIKLEIKSQSSRSKINKTCSLTSKCEEALEKYTKTYQNSPSLLLSSNLTLLADHDDLSTSICALPDSYESICYCDKSSSSSCYNGIKIDSGAVFWKNDFDKLYSLQNEDLPTDINQFYQNFWNSSLSIVTMVMMLLSSLAANSDFIINSIKKEPRIRICLKVLVVLLCLNTFLVFPEWLKLFTLPVGIFFCVTIGLALLINFFSGIYQTTMFQITSCLPTNFFNYFLQGQAAGGIFANLIAILCGALADQIFDICSGSVQSDLTDPDPDLELSEDASSPEIRKLNNKSFLALIFFTTAVVIVISTLFAFNRLQTRESFQYYYSSSASPRKDGLKEVELENVPPTPTRCIAVGEPIITMELAEQQPLKESVGSKTDYSIEQSAASIFEILKKVWLHYLSIFVIFGTTLTVFPTLLSEIKPTSNFFARFNPSQEAQDQCGIYKLNAVFLKVVVLLMFNLGDYLGRLLANKCELGMTRENSGLYGLILALIRFLIFIKIFFMTNFTGFIEGRLDSIALDELEEIVDDNRDLPPYNMSLFHNDGMVTVLILMFGLTNGYFATLALQFLPLQFPVSHKKSRGKAGGYAITIITLGLLFGSILSFVWVTPVMNFEKSSHLETALIGKLKLELDGCEEVCGKLFEDNLPEPDDIWEY